eukprot:COSAG02_NODE_53715_length_300_cov_0.741294_1_plen_33_part_10
MMTASNEHENPVQAEQVARSATVSNTDDVLHDS